MLPSFARQTITRIRPGTKIERGSTVPDWSNVNEQEIYGCSVQPAGTTLTQDGRIEGIMDGLTAYVPEGTDIKASDRVMYDGNVYTITGDPRIWVGANRCSHVQLNLQRWRG